MNPQEIKELKNVLKDNSESSSWTENIPHSPKEAQYLLKTLEAYEQRGEESTNN